MLITFLPSTLVAKASQINLRLLPNAKSRTLSALKTQVFVVLTGVFSAFFASSNVTTSTGSENEVCALFQRANCVALNTAG